MASKVIKFLPSIFQTETNDKFLSATLDQLISEPDLKKVYGYIGRKFAPTYKSGDSYIQEPTAERQNYQLEPSVIIKENNDISLFSGYTDILNKLKFYGGNVSDHNRLFENQYYSFDPLIDYDKFINFSQYYWLENGPDFVDVYPGIVESNKTFDIARNNLGKSYNFSAESTYNPTIILARGGTYTFNLNQPGNKFWIQSYPGISGIKNNTKSISSRDIHGVDNNGADSGSIVFSVPQKNAQEQYLNMPLLYDADFTTNAAYSQVHGSLLSTFLSKFNGFDGVVSQLDGKTLVFVNQQNIQDTLTYNPENPYITEDAWTTKGLHKTESWDQDTWDQIIDTWDQSQFEQGTVVPEEDRVSLWTIKLIPTSNILTLSGNVSISAGTRISQNLSGASAIVTEDVVNSNVVKISLENNQIFTTGTGIVQFNNINQVVYPISTPNDDYLIRLDNKDSNGVVRKIPINNKVSVKSGITYAGREFFNNYNNTLIVVPYITSNLDTLYYQDSNNSEMYGIIKIVDLDNWNIDVNNDILGKKTYTSPNGVVFTNGLKIRFDTRVIQTEYHNNQYYVEGVGTSIKLVPVELLVTPESYHKILSDSTGTTVHPDYILINRSSVDLNPWSRNNKWFHKDIIEVTASYNKTTPLFNQSLRAVRPIIEFESNLQLFNNGRIGKKYIDLIDTHTVDAFNSFHGQNINNAYGIDLVDGMRIVFANDYDPLVKNKIYIINFIHASYDSNGNPIGYPQINLTKATDGDILEYDTVVVTSGLMSGTSWWFNGVSWLQSQQKNQLNQAPKFDVFDNVGNSFSTYERSTFKGTQIFGYQQSSNGIEDPVLGFKLSYRNFTTQGEIEFKNYFDTDNFEYLQSATTEIIPINHGFLNVIDSRYSVSNRNVWNTVVEPSKQYQLLSYESDGTSQTIRLPVTINEEDTIPYIKVFVNSKFLNRSLWTKTNLDITIQQTLLSGDNVDILIFTDTIVSSDLYQIPLNLDYNAQNLDFTSLSLGQIRNHVIELAQNSNNIVGEIVGENNLRDIQYKQQGGNILQHSSPVPYSGLFLNDKVCNFVDSIRYAQQEYIKFKNKFLELAVGLPNVLPTDPVYSVDLILQQINGFKNNTFPWYYSDMVPYGTNKKIIESIVYNPLVRSYEINNIFNDQELSNKSVLVYLNSDPNATYLAGTGINVISDIINQTEYVSPDGVVFENNMVIRFGGNVLPEHYQNKSYQVQGVGSYITLLPINNNVQLVKGRDYIFDQTKPAIIIDQNVKLEIDYRLTIVEYSSTDGNYIPETPTKLGLYPKFTPEFIFDNSYVNDINVIVGHDGSKTPAFGDYRDDFLLELEKRIYNNIKVEYTSQSFNIYDVIPGKFRKNEYSLQEFDSILTTNFLTWVGNNNVDYITNTTFDSNNPFTWNYALFSDNVNGEKLQGSWRAIYKYFYDTDTPNYTPWEMLGFSEKPDWWEKYYGPAPYTGTNDILWEDLSRGYIRDGIRKGIDIRFSRPGLMSFIPVNQNGFLISPPEFLTKSFNEKNAVSNWAVGYHGPVETAWRKSSEFPYAMQIALALTKPAKYFGSLIDTKNYNYNKSINQYLITTTNHHIKQTDIVLNGDVVNETVIRTAGYINWIVDSVKKQGIDPYTTINKLLTSYQVNLAYKMAGFSDQSFLRILAEQYSPTSTNDSIVIPNENYNIFLNKSTPVDKLIYSGVIVQKSNNGYTVRGYNLENPYFNIIPSTVTGKSTKITVLDITASIFLDHQMLTVSIPYGYEFKTPQQVVDFLISYERYLKLQGFKFEDVHGDLGEIQNWTLSSKEFLYWIQQGWAVGSILVLSPVNNSLKLTTNGAIVDGIVDNMYGSKVLDQNFNMVRNINYGVTRSPTDFSVTLTNSQVIGLVELSLVQYEHILVFDNVTVFNDVIYKPELGNRQFRLKLIGQKTNNWDGSLSPSGFIYNSKNVQQWNPGVDYLKGDLVHFKNQYYVALISVVSSSQFDFSKWKLISIEDIKTGLLPNLAFNAWQGKTYYDNYSELVNSSSQSYNKDKSLYSYGLIGFKPRSYLTDLGLTDSTQVELYKGFIAQKGTKNSVTALTKSQFNDITAKIDFYEDWAVRVGEYGAIDINPWVEVELNETLYSTNAQVLEFVNDTNLSNGVTVISTNDLYKQSGKYTGKISLNRTKKTYSNDIMSAGYVNINDVDATIFDISNYVELNSKIHNIGSGYTIWCAKDFDTDWNVYRVTETNNNIISVSNALNGLLSVTCKEFHKLSNNSLILIKNFNSIIDGFYQVTKIVNLNTFIVKYFGTTTITSLTGNGLLYQLDSLRFSYMEDVRRYTPLNGWKSNEKVWIDNVDSDSQWAVYEKVEPWTFNSTISRTKSEYQSDDLFGQSLKSNSLGTMFVVGSPNNTTVSSINLNSGVGIADIFVKTNNNQFELSSSIFPSSTHTQHFGYSVGIANNYIAIGAPNSENGVGHVYVYKIAEFTSETQLVQILKGTIGDLFGSAISFSLDGRWLYISAPGTGKLYSYALDETIIKKETISVVSSINKSTIVPWNITDSDNLTIFGPGINYIKGTDYTVLGSTITFSSGVLPTTDTNIVINQNIGYRYVQTILNPGIPNDQFGYAISVSSDGAQVAVGAPGATVGQFNNAGKVYVYDRSIESFTTISQNQFTTSNNLQPIIRVIVDGVELNKNEYIVNSNTVTIKNPPLPGSIVTIESNNFKLLQELTGSNPQENSRHGSTLTICSFNCAIYIGSPGQDLHTGNQHLPDNQTIIPLVDKGIVINGGAVFKNHNQGRLYGTIAGTVINPTVHIGHSIRLNDFEVVFSGSTLNDVVNDINNANIIGISAVIESSLPKNVYSKNSLDNKWYDSNLNIVSNSSLLNYLNSTNQLIISVSDNKYYKTSTWKNNIGIEISDAYFIELLEQNKYLRLNSQSQISRNKLRVLTGTGTAIADLGLQVFVQMQIISSPNPTVGEQFGTKIALNNEAHSLVISSSGGNTNETTTFDNNLLTFDSNSTEFVDYVKSSGSVYLFELYDDPRDSVELPGRYSFTQQFNPGTLQSADNYGAAIEIVDNSYVIITSTNSSSVKPRAGEIYLFENINSNNGWNKISQQNSNVDIDSISRIYLYDKTSNKILTNLEFIDPCKGKILGQAEQEITYKTVTDPAVYNKGSNSNVNISTTTNWDSKQLYKVWWNLGKVRYVNYEQSDLIYRSLNWATEFPGSEIEVCEWTESDVLPSKYNDHNYDGTPLYPDDSAYVETITIDPIIGTILTKYYYWVKNKKSLTQINGPRKLPISGIVDLIQSPEIQNIPYSAIIQDNAIIFYNISDYLSDNNTVLHIDYSTTNNSLPVHSEYQLIQNNPTNVTSIPLSIVNKLIDSLAGIDQIGGLVPDPKLNDASKYGISIRPRQTMIVDKVSALSLVVSYLNTALKNIRIDDPVKIKSLSNSELIPSEMSNQWDIKVNTFEDLYYLNINDYNVGYKVLVESDSTQDNLWVIYIKDNNSTWQVNRVQSYNTRQYWSYNDWYLTGYDNNITVTYIHPTYSSAMKTQYKAGDIIKILDSGNGNWVLLEAIENTNFIYNGSSQFKTIAIQNGTVSIDNSIGNYTNKGLGFDNQGFGISRYDQDPGIEIRNILTTLLIDYVSDPVFSKLLDDIFFMLINYIHNEQSYVDWIFKTSFVTVFHQLRSLVQSPNYINDNQTFYEDYINEVKPYKTKIREYVLNYTGIDTFNGSVTDFDLPPYYDSELKLYRSPSGEYPTIDSVLWQQKPYVDWYNNRNYEIGSIVVENPGKGYTLTPTVEIISATGSGATAHAVVNFDTGKIIDIIVDNPGSGYSSIVTVKINGNGKDAAAYAVFKQNQPRGITTTIKFDRISKNSLITNWAANTVYKSGDVVSFNGNAYQFNFNNGTSTSYNSGTVFNYTEVTPFSSNLFLNSNDRIVGFYNPNKEMPAIDVINESFITSNITVNSNRIYVQSTVDDGNGNNLYVESVKKLKKGMFITGSNVKSAFITNVVANVTSMTNYIEVDQIQNITSESIITATFNSLGQLINGIDFPGVQVSGLPYDKSPGFSVDPNFGSDFDSYDNGTDGIITVSNNSFDTHIQSLYTDTILGTRPEDINIDGGKFYDIYNGSSPEELVAGTVYDTLDMKVYTTVGSSVLGYRIFNNMNNEISYLRLSGSSETTLKQNLQLTDTSIYVTDASVLPNPDRAIGLPGVIFINGERITYYRNYRYEVVTWEPNIEYPVDAVLTYGNLVSLNTTISVKSGDILYQSSTGSNSVVIIDAINSSNVYLHYQNNIPLSSGDITVNGATVSNISVISSEYAYYKTNSQTHASLIQHLDITPLPFNSIDVLTQLRRGTQGTSVPNIHMATQYVIDASSQQHIPNTNIVTSTLTSNTSFHVTNLTSYILTLDSNVTANVGDIITQSFISGANATVLGNVINSNKLLISYNSSNHFIAGNIISAGYGLTINNINSNAYPVISTIAGSQVDNTGNIQIMSGSTVIKDSIWNKLGVNTPTNGSGLGSGGYYNTNNTEQEQFLWESTYR